MPFLNVSAMKSKAEGVLSLLENLTGNTPGMRSLDNTDLDETRFYISFVGNNLLKTQTAKVFVKNYH